MRHLTMTRQCQHSSPCWSKPAPKIDLYLWDTSHQYIVDQNLDNNQNHPIIIIITNTVDQNLICDWFWIPSISVETNHRPCATSCGVRYKACGFEQIASSQMYFQHWQIISLLRRLCRMPRVWLICLSTQVQVQVQVQVQDVWRYPFIWVSSTQIKIGFWFSRWGSKSSDFLKSEIFYHSCCLKGETNHYHGYRRKMMYGGFLKSEL